MCNCAHKGTQNKYHGSIYIFVHNNWFFKQLISSLNIVVLSSSLLMMRDCVWVVGGGGVVMSMIMDMGGVMHVYIHVY